MDRSKLRLIASEEVYWKWGVLSTSMVMGEVGNLNHQRVEHRWAQALKYSNGRQGIKTCKVYWPKFRNFRRRHGFHYKKALGEAKPADSAAAEEWVANRWHFHLNSKSVYLLHFEIKMLCLSFSAFGLRLLLTSATLAIIKISNFYQPLAARSWGGSGLPCLVLGRLCPSHFPYLGSLLHHVNHLHIRDNPILWDHLHLRAYPHLWDLPLSFYQQL